MLLMSDVAVIVFRSLFMFSIKAKT